MGPRRAPRRAAMFVLTALAVLAVGAAAGASPPPYRPIDLGALSGGYAEPVAISDTGQVVGSGWAGSNPQALLKHVFSWTAATGMVDLGTLGSRYTYASDVNESGQIVGYANNASSLRAFTWTKEDGMVDIGTLGGASAMAVAVNDAGQVVGSSSTPGGQQHAFLWTKAGGMIDLGTL